MAAHSTPGNGSQLLVVNDTGGVTVIDPSTPLKRLNYYDGKFLRAADLALEQGYLRQLVALSNQGLGAGVAYGYDTVLGGGDTLQIGPGLAFAPGGQVLLLQSTVTQGIQALIDTSRKTAPSAPDASGKTGPGSFSDCVQVAAPPPTSVVPVSDIYVIVICAAEALCGQEDVFGIACQDACVSSTDRPYRLDGIVLRAIPLQLVTPFPHSKAVSIDSTLYLRSKVAHSYYADEVLKHPDAISREGLLSGTWCLGAGYDNGCCEVPLAVVARSGATTLFLDAWIARRERIDAPAKRYWQWKMMMRPQDVFLAQILQFQCQLSGLFRQMPEDGSGDPCARANALLQEANARLVQLLAFYQAVTQRFTVTPLVNDGNASDGPLPTVEGGLQALLALQQQLQNAGTASQIQSTKFLIDGGILELPSAGYLPILPNGGTVNEQVRRLLGQGVDLRFCIVRPDFVAHALEEAQHMERISLLQGLDDPKNRPKVDILVPNGEFIEQKLTPAGIGFEAELDVNALLFEAPRKDPGQKAAFSGAQRIDLDKFTNSSYGFLGAARTERLAGGGGAAYLAAEYQFVFRDDTTANSTDDSANAPQATAAAGIAGAPSSFSGDAATTGDFNQTVGISRNPRGGAWISLSCERDVFGLTRGDASNFNARALVASSLDPSGPILDLEINDVLEITQETVTTGGAETLKGRIRNARLFFKIPATGASGPRQSVDVDLNATLIRTGGTATDLILTIPGSEESLITLSADWGGQPLKVKALIGAGEGGKQILRYAQSALLENPAVQEADNIKNQLALDALNIIGTALRDHNFAAAKARLLFPPPPPPVDDILVRATADWVLFHRRREKHCGIVKEAPPPKPPETYRIFNISAENLEEARRIAKQITVELANPPQFANRINALADSDVDLVIAFAGGSATPQFDFPAADTQWQRLNPGEQIAAVFYGSKDAPNESLQTARLRQFESAIGGDSQELADGSTQLYPLVPFPEQAMPPDADGIMLFVTVAAPAKTVFLYTFGRDTDVFDRQMNTQAPAAKVEFRGGQPQGGGLQAFLSNLKTYRTQRNTGPGPLGFECVTLWSSDPVGDAGPRGEVVAKGLLDNNLTTANAPGSVVQFGPFPPVGGDNTLKSRIISRFAADSPDILDGKADVVFIEVANVYAEELNPKAPLLKAVVEEASTGDTGNSMRMKLTISNGSDRSFRLGEVYCAAARFLDPKVVKDTTGYPDDLLAEDGLTVSDNSPLDPGQTRTVEVVVADSAWQGYHLREQIEAGSAGTRSFGIRLFFYGPSLERETCLASIGELIVKQLV